MANRRFGFLNDRKYDFSNVSQTGITDSRTALPIFASAATLITQTALSYGVQAMQDEGFRTFKATSPWLMLKSINTLHCQTIDATQTWGDRSWR